MERSASTSTQEPERGGSFSRQQEYTAERRRYWDEFADSLGRGNALRKHYQKRLREIYSFLVPPGMRVLELGSGEGDLLAALRPSYGVGVDLSPRMVERARQRHPESPLSLPGRALPRTGRGVRFHRVFRPSQRLVGRAANARSRRAARA